MELKRWGGEKHVDKEEGSVELENRSCRMEKKERMFNHCGGRDIEGLLNGGGQCLV